MRRFPDTGALSRMKELLFDHIKKSNEVMYQESSKVLKTRLNKMIKTLEELLAETHTDTSKYLRKEIGDMIMLAVAKDDEAREKVRLVRNTLRKDLKLELNILEAAWVRSASEPTDSLLSVKTEGKPFDESSDDDDNTEDAEDTDDSNSSDEAQSISDDVEDS
ncbi:hypothetical protein OCU04_008693 [Sclerotinia nivalis]|uniref:Uncharacterized protein n=1 Tax=Sclerotinia nivalis TaxID=352851 RepID=A0A9X0DIL7_9HELO|nr:hypothetical protein OCU04_008693 [Sclerotinia nivalis]